MELGEIFKAVQKAIIDIPLLLVGSGNSVSVGLPGMEELGKHLIDSLHEKYKSDAEWGKFYANINNGQDLETALSKISLPLCILDEIKNETWKLISKKDIELFEKIISCGCTISLSKLIRKLNQTHPQCLNIITSNYDRVIEYACDSINLYANTGFYGNYIKRYRGEFPKANTVNLIKIHGSLDLFEDSTGVSLSIPMQHEIPGNLIPVIITPGSSKYRAVLKGTSRQLLNESDSAINKAASYLCIGYGFNDEQIQENIVAGIRSGKPIVVITKKLSKHAADLLSGNSQYYISIECGEDRDTTKFCMNRTEETVEGTYWTVDGFMEVID
ncbi:SIR2 family protein [Sphaerochaeta sp. UBA5856]|jgi:hypothetical protein|uniref:SIR2 family protein n=1 Tax=Sphaerochaeta sp. UBA5856 TaxID=1947476 RepID=UPI0025EC0AB4|nr:SIR2 family protein [Sphaerochaeta sp. UBA5856]